MLIDSVRVRNYRSIEDSGRLALGPVTLLVGRNNSGKSALLRSLLACQGPAAAPSSADFRLHSTDGPQVELKFHPGSEIYQRLGIGQQSVLAFGDTSYRWTANAQGVITSQFLSGGQPSSVGMFQAVRPNHLFVPVLARRKGAGYDLGTTSTGARTVGVSDYELTSRIDALTSGTHAEGQKYMSLVDEVLELKIETFIAGHGKQPGLVLNSLEGIPLDRMGEGISGTVALLSALAFGGEYVYLLEEPENDLHPRALIALMNVIRDHTPANQFIVSTHSDVVVRHLGAVEGSRVYATSLDQDKPVPTTRYAAVEDFFERRELLADLGYEPASPLAWIVFEESTAESIVNRILIPQFVPRLAAIRTVSASGVDRVEAHFDDLLRTVLFLHLDHASEAHDAWVAVDGDDGGRAMVDRLAKKFKTWPPERFHTFPAADFESFYPARFDAKVSEIKAASHGLEKQKLKAQLVEEVLAWARSSPDEAKDDFAVSAAPVIEFLETIERELQ